jgi:hypothetical protein
MTALRIFFLILDFGGRFISMALLQKLLESCNGLFERAAMRAQRMIRIELNANFTRH